MDFVHYDLGHLEEGTTVAVFLQSAANVCILTSTNFTHYKLGYSFNYLGGYITHSPYYAVIPIGEYWHVVIDLGGYEGCVSSRVETIPPEKTEVGLTFMGYPAMKYPNKKKPPSIYRLLVWWSQWCARWTWTRSCDYSKFNWEHCYVERTK